MAYEIKYKWVFELHGERHVAVVTGTPARAIVRRHLRQIHPELRTLALEVLQSPAEIEAEVARLRRDRPGQLLAGERFPENPNRIFTEPLATFADGEGDGGDGASVKQERANCEPAD